MLLSERSLWSLWGLSLNWGFKCHHVSELEIRYQICQHKNNLLILYWSWTGHGKKTEKVETSRKSWALLWEKKLEKDKTPSRFFQKRKKIGKVNLFEERGMLCHRWHFKYLGHYESASSKVESHHFLRRKKEEEKMSQFYIWISTSKR